METKRVALFVLLAEFAALPLLEGGERKPRGGPDRGYAAIVSRSTRADPGWSKVVAALTRNHGAEVLEYEKSIDEVEEPLAARMPRYACFVARPEEAGRKFVAKVHRLTRKLDQDPYTDVIWGILTGHGPEDALRLAELTEPLVVRKGLGGTGINLDLFEEGKWFSEGEAGAYHEKAPGGKPEKKKGPQDSTKALVDAFNEFKTDLFVTSGHATERDWQIGYSYRNGQFRAKAGKLFGLDLEGRAFPIQSPNPKIYLPMGNCLMGHVKDKESMALAFMGSGGVAQMMGYTVSTWFGYGGWGVGEYFFGRPGELTFSEAFHSSIQAVVHELESRFPKTAQAEVNDWNIETDPQLIGRIAASLGYTEWNDTVKDNVGLLWDRDTVAFYGDPAWEARLLPRELPWEQELREKDGVYTFEVKARKDARCRRPPLLLFPHRLLNVEVIEGSDLKPVIADDFILLPSPAKLEGGKTYRVVFKASRVNRV